MNGRLLREAFCLMLRLTALPFVIYRYAARRRLTIILYHAIDPELFRRHLQFLKKRYHIIKMSDYLEFRSTGGELPDFPLVITFDDGHRENYSLLPVLRETGVPVTIFLCSALTGTKRHFWFKEYRNFKLLKQLPDAERLRRLEKAGFRDDREYDDSHSLSEEQVAILKEMVDFQSHSMTHPVLPLCSAIKSRREIRQSRRDLEREFGLQVTGFSFPDGLYSEREIEFVREAGYSYALTLEPGFNDATVDLFRLRRISIPDWAGIHFLSVKCSGIWHWMKKFMRKRWV